MSNMKPIHKVINYLLREQLPDDPNKEATHSMCKFYSADPDREGSGRCSKFNSYVQGAEAVCGSYESEGSDESESVMKEAVKAKHLQFVIDGKYSVVTTTDWLKRKGWLNAGVTLVRLEWDRDGDGKLVTVAGPPSVLDRMKYEVGGRIVIPDRYESKVTDVISSLLED